MDYQDQLKQYQNEGYDAVLMVWRLTRIMEAEGYGCKSADIKARHELVKFLHGVTI